MADFFDMSKWVNQVRDAIAPVIPTHILYLGHDLYEARWSQPSIPQNDMEALQRIKHIKVIAEPYTPSDLPNWTAIRFVWRRDKLP